MTTVQETWDGCTFEVTPTLLAFFDANRIRTTQQAGVHRWPLGRRVFSGHGACFHKNSMLLQGDHVTALGAFSYSLSPLTPYDRLGRYCSISWNVRMMGPQHNINFTTSSEILYRQDGFFADMFGPDWQFCPNPQKWGIEVGHDVWIGQDVLIKPGIKIGTGAVVAAGAVVVKDVEPYEVVGGVPARRLKMRFPQDVADELLQLEWWKFSIPELPNLPWDRPEALIAAMRPLIANGSIPEFVSNLGYVRDIMERMD